MVSGPCLGLLSFLRGGKWFNVIEAFADIDRLFMFLDGDCVGVAVLLPALWPLLVFQLPDRDFDISTAITSRIGFVLLLRSRMLLTLHTFKAICMRLSYLENLEEAFLVAVVYFTVNLPLRRLLIFNPGPDLHLPFLHLVRLVIFL